MDIPSRFESPDAIQVEPLLTPQLGPGVLWEGCRQVNIFGPGGRHGHVRAQLLTL